MGYRTLLVLVFVPFLLLTSGGCAAKREVLRPDGASPSVRTRVPPAEAIGLRLEREDHPAPPIPLPLTEADKAGARTLAAPGVGWLMLIEVNFSVSSPPRVYSAPPEQVWVPGRYETRYQRQWVPGHRESVRQ